MGEAIENIKKGLIRINPIFVLALGLCPTLAVSTSLDNALGMTAAVLFVLMGANIIVSLIKDITPSRVRIPVFIVIIATLVTIVDLLIQAFSQTLSESLGIYVPLIVVNCIILGRAEAFASKNSLSNSMADAFGMGIGFGFGILLVSFFRELLGTGELELLGFHLISIPGLSAHPMGVFILPIGAFLVVGVLLATFRYFGVIDNE